MSRVRKDVRKDNLQSLRPRTDVSSTVHFASAFGYRMHDSLIEDELSLRRERDELELQLRKEC